MLRTRIIVVILLLSNVFPEKFRVGLASPLYEWNKPYPACWETSRLKAPPASGNSEYDGYDKMVVIGDIHGNWNGFMEVLGHAGAIAEGSKRCEWKKSNQSMLLVQTGDVVDRGRFATECFECLQYLQSTAGMFGNRVVRLIGNHELMWLGAIYDYRNPDTDTFPKINKLTKKIVDDILRNKLHGSFYTDSFGGVPILLTHAGLRNDMKTNILSRSTDISSMPEGKAIYSFINNILHDDIQKCYISRGYTDSFNDKIRCGIFLTDLIYSVGKERGGNSLGGVMWTDYHVLEQESLDTMWDFVQIVGHTIQKGKIRTTSKLKSTCVDAGMVLGGRAYLSISHDGKFFSYEKDLSTSDWILADLTNKMCG